MKIRDVIRAVRKLRPGCDVSLEEAVAALNLLEEDIYANIISRHADTPIFSPHSDDTDELLVPDMYADLYSMWLLARFDLANGDIGGYTNNMILYNNLMTEFGCYYTRNHMPIQAGRVRWR